jgi:hypothetical protein
VQCHDHARPAAHLAGPYSKILAYKHYAHCSPPSACLTRLSQLLLEREGDLIAAYDIGKKLLEKNKRLEQRVDELEEIQEEMDKEKVEMLLRLEKSGGEEGKAKDGEIARLQEQLKAAKEAEAKIHAQSEVTVAAVKDMGELIETQVR